MMPLTPIFSQPAFRVSGFAAAAAAACVLPLRFAFAVRLLFFALLMRCFRASDCHYIIAVFIISRHCRHFHSFRLRHFRLPPLSLRHAAFAMMLSSLASFSPFSDFLLLRLAFFSFDAVSYSSILLPFLMMIFSRFSPFRHAFRH